MSLIKMCFWVFLGLKRKLSSLPHTTRAIGIITYVRYYQWRQDNVFSELSSYRFHRESSESSESLLYIGFIFAKLTWSRESINMYSTRSRNVFHLLRLWARKDDDNQVVEVSKPHHRQSRDSGSSQSPLVWLVHLLHLHPVLLTLQLVCMTVELRITSAPLSNWYVSLMILSSSLSIIHII